MSGWFPKYNLAGDILSGNGALTLNGKDVAGPIPAWNPYPFDNNTAVFKGAGDFPTSYNWHTVEKLSPSPAERVRAGGGRYYIPNRVAGEIDASLDKYSAKLALLVEYNGSNNDHTVFLDGVPVDEHRTLSDPKLSEGLLVYSFWTGSGPTRRTLGFNSGPIQDLSVVEDSWEGFPIPFKVDGESWVLVQTNFDIRLHPWNSKFGYIIATGEDKNLYPDVIFLNGLINVICCDSQGNLLSEGGKLGVRIDPITHRVDVSRRAVNTPVPVSSSMIRAFDRPLWQAPYYSFHKRYGDTDINRYKEYANAISITGDETDPSVRDTELDRLVNHAMPLLVDIGTHRPEDKYNDLIVAWVAAGNSIESLKDDVTRALNYVEKPVIAYLDSDNWPESDPFDSDRVWPSIMAYRYPLESFESFKVRLDAIIEKVSKYNRPMVLTSRFDDFNGSSTIVKIAECAPLYEKWIRDYFFVGHMPFADRRGNGIAKNESLFQIARAFNYAIPFERPNRFDYWEPSELNNIEVLKNKFGQTRASVVIEPYLREDILNRYGHGPGPIEPPPTGEMPALTTRQVKVIQELYDRNKVLAHSTDDNDRRKLTFMMAEQFCFEFGPRYGTKSTTPTHPQSKDAIAYNAGEGKIHVWDWQNGATREPQVHVGQEPDHKNLDQHFIKVNPVNHLS